jgi:3-oxoacyl-[acyl-carrier protein] reductase
LWSHPEPVVTAYRKGGWSYDVLHESFAAEIGGNLQSVGERLPPLPTELQRPAAPVESRP